MPDSETLSHTTWGSCTFRERIITKGKPPALPGDS